MSSEKDQPATDPFRRLGDAISKLRFTPEGLREVEDADGTSTDGAPGKK